MEPKNYINLTNYYHIAGQPVVIQAYKLGNSLVVVSPMAFLLRWRSVKATDWKEVDHAPGMISEEEWKLLISESVL